MNARPAALSEISTGPAPGVVVRRRVIDRRTRLMAVSVALLGTVFLSLALALHASAGTAVDLAVTHAVQQIDDPAFTSLMVAISAPGYYPWTWIVLACASLAFLAAGLWREALLILATECAAMLVSFIKLLVERPRPNADSVRVMSHLLDFSFPSGHVVGYVTLYGLLAFLIYVRFRRSWQRTLGLVVAGMMIGLVGLSRVHLGYHWASDVLGGHALGTAYLLCLIEAYRLLVVRPVRPNLPPEGSEVPHEPEPAARGSVPRST